MPNFIDVDCLEAGVGGCGWWGDGHFETNYRVTYNLSYVMLVQVEVRLGCNNILITF